MDSGDREMAQWAGVHVLTAGIWGLAHLLSSTLNFKQEIAPEHPWVGPPNRNQTKEQIGWSPHDSRSARKLKTQVLVGRSYCGNSYPVEVRSDIRFSTPRAFCLLNRNSRAWTLGGGHVDEPILGPLISQPQQDLERSSHSSSFRRVPHSYRNGVFNHDPNIVFQKAPTFLEYYIRPKVFNWWVGWGIQSFRLCSFSQPPSLAV